MNRPQKRACGHIAYGASPQFTIVMAFRTFTCAVNIPVFVETLLMLGVDHHAGQRQAFGKS